MDNIFYELKADFGGDVFVYGDYSQYRLKTDEMLITVDIAIARNPQTDIIGDMFKVVCNSFCGLYHETCILQKLSSVKDCLKRHIEKVFSLSYNKQALIDVLLESTKDIKKELKGCLTNNKSKKLNGIDTNLFTLHKNEKVTLVKSEKFVVACLYDFNDTGHPIWALEEHDNYDSALESYNKQHNCYHAIRLFKVMKEGE